MSKCNYCKYSILVQQVSLRVQDGTLLSLRLKLLPSGGANSSPRQIREGVARGFDEFRVSEGQLGSSKKVQLQVYAESDGECKLAGLSILDLTSLEPGKSSRTVQPILSCPDSRAQIMVRVICETPLLQQTFAQGQEDEQLQPKKIHRQSDQIKAPQIRHASQTDPHNNALSKLLRISKADETNLLERVASLQAQLRERDRRISNLDKKLELCSANQKVLQGQLKKRGETITAKDRQLIKLRSQLKGCRYELEDKCKQLELMLKEKSMAPLRREPRQEYCSTKESRQQQRYQLQIEKIKLASEKSLQTLEQSTLQVQQLTAFKERLVSQLKAKDNELSRRRQAQESLTKQLLQLKLKLKETPVQIVVNQFENSISIGTRQPAQTTDIQIQLRKKEEQVRYLKLELRDKELKCNLVGRLQGEIQLLREEGKSLRKSNTDKSTKLFELECELAKLQLLRVVEESKQVHQNDSAERLIEGIRKSAAFKQAELKEEIERKENQTSLREKEHSQAIKLRNKEKAEMAEQLKKRMTQIETLRMEVNQLKTIKAARQEAKEQAVKQTTTVQRQVASLKLFKITEMTVLPTFARIQESRIQNQDRRKPIQDAAQLQHTRATVESQKRTIQQLRSQLQQSSRSKKKSVEFKQPSQSKSVALLQDELSSAKESIKATERELTDLRRSTRLIEGSSKNRTTIMEGIIQNIKGNKAECEEQARRLQQQLIETKQRLLQAQLEIETLRKQLATQQDITKDRPQVDKSEMQKFVGLILQNRQSQIHEIEPVRRELAMARVQLESLEEQLNRGRAQSRELKEARARQQQAQLSQRRQFIELRERLNKKVFELESACQSKDGSISRLQNRLKRITGEKNALEEQITLLKKEIWAKGNQLQIAKLKEDLARQKEERKLIEQAVSRKQKQLQVLREAVAKASKTQREKKSQAEAHRVRQLEEQLSVARLRERELGDACEKVDYQLKLAEIRESQLKDEINYVLNLKSVNNPKQGGSQLQQSNDTYERRCSTLQTELKSSRAKLEAKSLEYKQLARKLAQKQRELETLVGRVNVAKQETASLQTANDQLQGKVFQLERKISQVAIELDSSRLQLQGVKNELQQQTRNSNEERRRARAKELELQGQLQRTSLSLAQCERQLSQIKTLTVFKQKEYKRMQNEYQRLLPVTDTLRDRLDQQQKELLIKRKQAQLLENDCDRLRAEQQSRTEQKRNLQARLQQSRAQLSQVRMEQQQALRKVTQLAAELKECESTVQILQERNERLAKSEQLRQGESAIARKQVDELNQVIKNYQEELFLKEAESMRLKGKAESIAAQLKRMEESHAAELKLAHSKMAEPASSEQLYRSRAQIKELKYEKEELAQKVGSLIAILKEAVGQKKQTQSKLSELAVQTENISNDSLLQSQQLCQRCKELQSHLAQSKQTKTRQVAKLKMDLDQSEEKRAWAENELLQEQNKGAKLQDQVRRMFEYYSNQTQLLMARNQELGQRVQIQDQLQLVMAQLERRKSELRAVVDRTASLMAKQQPELVEQNQLLQQKVQFYEQNYILKEEAQLILTSLQQKNKQLRIQVERLRQGRSRATISNSAGYN